MGQTFLGATEQMLEHKLEGGPDNPAPLFMPSYTFDGHAEEGLKESKSGIKHFRDNLKSESHKLLRQHRYNEKLCTRWCYDTPGLVNPSQVLIVSPDESWGYSCVCLHYVTSCFMDFLCALFTPGVSKDFLHFLCLPPRGKETYCIQ